MGPRTHEYRRIRNNREGEIAKGVTELERTAETATIANPYRQLRDRSKAECTDK